jgi:hypothetical protein
MHLFGLSFFLLFLQGSAPTLVSIEPSSIVQGTTVAVTFKGSGFIPQRSGPEIPSADAGGLQGFSIAGGTQYLDDTTMVVLWRVMAPAGKYYVDVANSAPLSPSVMRSNLLPLTVLPAEIPSTPDYQVTTFAGKPGGPGASDGRGEAARFQGASNGMWGDGQSLYVSDNYTIRKVDIATGLVSSIAGMPYIKNYADGVGSEARLNGPGPVWGDGTNLYVLENSSGGTSSTLRKVVLATGEVSTVGARGQLAATEMSGCGPYLCFSVARTIYGMDPGTGQMAFSVGLEQVSFPTNNVTYQDRPIPLWSDQNSIYLVDNGSMDPQKPRSLIRRIDLQTLQVTNIAGSGSQVGYVNGAGSFARLNYPTGLWGDGTNLYVTDTGNRAIRKIDLASNEVSTLAGFPEPRRLEDENYRVIDGPASTARFSNPVRIWGDGTYLYVSDLFVIRRVTIATGDVITIAGSPWNTGPEDGIGTAAHFVNALSITGNKNDLFLLDSLRGAIRKIHLANAEVQTVGSLPVAIFQPIWVDETNLYTVDPNTGLVQELDLSTGTLRQVASLPNLGVVPVFTYRGISGDANNLYIGGNKKIYKVVIATGEVSILAGKGLVTGSSDEFLPKDGIGEAAQFVSPTGIWSDGTALYVADTRLIRKVLVATREVTTIAGGDLASGIIDGIGRSASFNQLRAITGDGRYLYVIESNSTRVRRIAIDTGEVTTIAGQFGKAGSEDGIGSAARFTATAGIWSDGTNVYVSDIATIRQATPIPPSVSTANFATSSNGAALMTTAGTAADITVGFAKVQQTSKRPVAGTALFRYRQNGVLITEAGVPAARPIQRGRIYTESAPFVRTGVAIANPNAIPVTISFFYTDESGADFGSGTTVIPANGQVSRFLDETPFNTATAGRSRTFTFNASAPVGAIALRGFTNERSEFLITTLPVTDLSTAKVRITFPHFAKGGGWSTNLVLVNTSDLSAEGDLTSLRDDGTVDATSSYSIAPRSAFTLRLPDGGSSIQTGHVRVTPKAGEAAPDGVLVFYYQRDGITVTETSVPGVEPGSMFGMYVEATTDVQTSIALANDASSEATVTLTVIGGASSGLSTTLKLPANGHSAVFVREIPGFDTLPPEFRGVVRITSDPGSLVSATALRSRYNERGDFLVSTMQVFDDRAAAASDLIFPHLADGGGYTTDFILFSTSSNPATGTLEFNTPSGAPLLLQLR